MGDSRGVVENVICVEIISAPYLIDILWLYWSVDNVYTMCM